MTSLNISKAFDWHHDVDVQKKDRLLEEEKTKMLRRWGLAEYQWRERPKFVQELEGYKKSIHYGERPVASIEKMRKLGLDAIEQVGGGPQTKVILKDKAISYLNEVKREAPGSASKFLKLAGALEIFACYALQSKLIQISSGEARQGESAEAVQARLQEAIHLLETFSRRVDIQLDVSMMHSEIKGLIAQLSDDLIEEEYLVLSPWIKQAIEILDETAQKKPVAVEEEVIVEMEEDQPQPQFKNNIESLMEFFPEDKRGRRDQEKVQELMQLEPDSTFSERELQATFKSQVLHLLEPVKPNRILKTRRKDAYAALDALKAFCLYATHSEHMLGQDNQEKVASHIRKAIAVIESLQENICRLPRKDLKPTIKALSKRITTILGEDLTSAEKKHFTRGVERAKQSVEKML